MQQRLAGVPLGYKGETVMGLRNGPSSPNTVPSIRIIGLVESNRVGFPNSIFTKSRFNSRVRNELESA